MSELQQILLLSVASLCALAAGGFVYWLAWREDDRPLDGSSRKQGETS